MVQNLIACNSELASYHASSASSSTMYLVTGEVALVWGGTVY